MRIAGGDEPVGERVLVVESGVVDEVEGYEVERRYIGVVESRRRSLTGFELGGTVAEVYFDEGDRVGTGDILVRLDVKRLAAELKEAESALGEARAVLELAELTMGRLSPLVIDGAVSQQALDESRQKRDTAMAALDRLEASRSRIVVQINKSEIRAPFAGVVVKRHVDEGSIIGSGQAAMEILETDVKEVRIGLALEAISRVAPGSVVTLNNRDGRQWNGRVRNIIPELESQSRTVPVVVEVQNAGYLISGELLSWAFGQTIQESGFRIPRRALIGSIRGLWSVFAMVPSADGTWVVESREIEILHNEAEDVVVRGALQSGDRIILSGLHRLVPGQLVKQP